MYLIPTIVALPTLRVFLYLRKNNPLFCQFAALAIKFRGVAFAIGLGSRRRFA